jgi:hypothetical protein
MPTSTDLVTDLPADFEVFGQAVDTRLKALQPGTTLGDLAYSSATANTNTRLGIGSTGNVLTVSGGVPVWSAPAGGSLTLLSTTTLSGATTTISSISGSYKNLYVEIEGVTNATANGVFRVAPNTTVDGTMYGGFGTVETTTSTYARNNDYLRLSDNTGQLTRTNANNAWVLNFPNYANSTYSKIIQSTGNYVGAATLNTCTETTTAVFFGSTSAITSLRFSNSGGNLSTGTVRVYGVN